MLVQGISNRKQVCIYTATMKKSILKKLLRVAHKYKSLSLNLAVIFGTIKRKIEDEDKKTSPCHFMKI